MHFKRALKITYFPIEVAIFNSDTSLTFYEKFKMYDKFREIFREIFSSGFSVISE